MSTVVCQGLQSCLESSHLLETQILRLRLASSRPCYFFGSKAGGAPFWVPEDDLRDKSHFKEIANNHISSNPELGGWSFLQALSSTSQSPKEGLLDKEISSYSHPMAKKSSSTLSNKSLELCTENLGSETGTDISESSIFSISSLDLQGGENPAKEEPPKSSRQQMEPKRVIDKSRDFPPPLTSISSSSSVQIRPHREGGRLIISAVEAPLRHTYLQAERSHGRLRLSFWKDCGSTTAFDSEMVTEEDEDSDYSSSSSLYSTSSSAAASSFASFSTLPRDDHGREDTGGNSFNAGVEMGRGKV